MQVTDYNVITAEENINTLLVPFGSYRVDTEYERTDDVAPVLEWDKMYYVLNTKGKWLGSTKATDRNNPKTDIQVNGVNASWKAYENMEYIFFKVLMANYAQLASAVFYGDYMFSQQGSDANGNVTSDFSGFHNGTFFPNIFFDFLTGVAKMNNLIAKNADISGTIRALMMYSSSRLITASGTLDLDNNPANMYIVNEPSHVYGITLPMANLYDTLELQFFVKLSTSDPWGNYSVSLLPSSGDKIYARKNGASVKNTSDVSIAVEQKFVQYQQVNESMMVQPNTLYRVKSILGNWYVIEGIWTGE